MSSSLTDLLEAETRAEMIVTRGEQERDAIIQKALADAHEMEKQFKARLPEMHQSFSDKARARAEQTIAEMKLRADERNKELRDQAGKNEKEALDNAIALILGTDEIER